MTLPLTGTFGFTSYYRLLLMLQSGPTHHLSLVTLSCFLSLQCPFLYYSPEILLSLRDSAQMLPLPLVTCVERRMCEVLEIHYFILTVTLQYKFYYPTFTVLKTEVQRS